jgi:hypothetical protein
MKNNNEPEGDIFEVDFSAVIIEAKEINDA